jgi:hypothetical protein
MGRDRRQSPRVESLEGRQLLSGVHFDHIVVNPGGPMAAAAAPVLNGTLKGSIASFTDLAGPPETMSETFTGRVRSMGRVRAVVVDQLDTNGNLIGGAVVLNGPRGSVTLAFGPGDMISGQEVGNITMQVVRYTIASGTGAFAHATGTGTFTVLQKMGSYTAVGSAPSSSTMIIETTTS